MSPLQWLVYGNVKLISFWITKSIALLNELPAEMKNLNTLKARIARAKLTGEPLELHVDKALINNYNDDLKRLEADIQQDHHEYLPIPFGTRQVAFFLVRLMTVMAALFSSHALFYTFVVSLLQFAVLPYSLFVSIAYGIATAFILFTGHVLVFPVIKCLVDYLCPPYLNVYIAFTPTILVALIALDQAFCAICLYRTPKGVTKKLSKGRIWQSVWYGFLNCKTYYLVLIPLLFTTSSTSFGIPVIAWLIDTGFGCSAFVGRLVGGYWELLFYHAHRMGHIRHVYPDAHKFHHYLADSTAFDGHIFGSGAPEEWLLLWLEYCIASCLCGGLPPSLSYHVLSASWYNKWGFHTRADLEEHHWRNFHVDHHTKHNANFGFEYPLEVLMKTASKCERDHIFDGCRIQRIESNQSNHITLKLIPL